MAAKYRVGDYHHEGDPIGNISVLKDLSDSGDPYLMRNEDGTWSWGTELGRPYLSAYAGSFGCTRAAGETRMLVLSVLSEDDAQQGPDTLTEGDRVRYNDYVGGLTRFSGRTGTVVRVISRTDAEVKWDGGITSIHDRTYLTRIVDAPETPEPKEVPTRAEVLREAERLITGDRNAHYGEPMDNFRNIAAFWNTFLKYKLKDGEEITAGDTAALMILVKVAREIAGSKEDNKIDIAGYAACWAEVDR